MNCKECREKLFALSEQEIEEGQQRYEMGSEVHEHLSNCPSCTALAEALEVISTEKALHIEPEEERNERIVSGVMERIGESIEEDEEDEIARRKTGRFSRVMSMAAAAVFLIVLSVSLTLFVTERKFPAGGASVAQETENKDQGETEGKLANREDEPANGTNSSTGKTEAVRKQGEPAAPQETITVRLTLEAPSAESVAVVGDWNGWDPSEHRMRDKNGDGVWELTLKVEKGGEYQYQFLINGKKWVPDPKAPLKVKDGFGGTNSVLDI